MRLNAKAALFIATTAARSWQSSAAAEPEAAKSAVATLIQA
jgi:hypothetical protein